jgi:hypothetical protein
MTRDSSSRRRMRDGSDLRDVVSGRRARSGSRDGEPSPSSTYEAVTRQMVRSLCGEVRDVKHRVNQLITLIIAAILLEVLMRLIGVSG